MKLLLFDIDGTMLRTNGIGRRTMRAALAETFGVDISIDGVSFSGKTDPQIIGEILTYNGRGEEARNGSLDHILDAYARTLRQNLQPEHLELLPGVKPLLDQLADDPGVQLALLTGNLEETAFLKLEMVGLDGYFSFGAFGSDHADRHALPAIAVERAYAHAQRRFAGKDVVIIGDTEHDILCGRALGVYAVAVCTGRFRRGDLEHHGPDLLLDDLTDADHFRETILGTRPIA